MSICVAALLGASLMGQVSHANERRKGTLDKMARLDQQLDALAVSIAADSQGPVGAAAHTHSTDVSLQQAAATGTGVAGVLPPDEQRRLEAITKQPNLGEALEIVGDSFNYESTSTFSSINPFAPEPEHNRARITVLAQSDGCGNTHDESSLIRPFFVDSGADPSTFHWCPTSGCDEALVLGGDTLHYDFGMVKLRGCPLHEGYTIPYLRLMKVLLGSFNTLYLGWGACDQGETNCAVGADVTMKPGDCKTLMHPLKPEQKYDVCFVSTM